METGRHVRSTQSGGAFNLEVDGRVSESLRPCDKSATVVQQRCNKCRQVLLELAASQRLSGSLGVSPLSPRREVGWVTR